MTKPLLLVGGGRMGGALLAGWRARGLQALVVDPGAPEMPGTTVLARAEDIPGDFQPDAVIFAIKPQAAARAVPDYGRFSGLFISIMAGRTIGGLTRLLGAPAAVVRAMPNTPAAIGQGFTVAVAGDAVSPEQRALADRLLGACGQVAWVEDEALLDAVTAISGGGPAYLFLLTELMERAAIDHGLEPALARAMARRTVIGSAALLAASDEDAAALRTAVTSPGGTTEQALAVLNGALPDLFAAATRAASQRSRKLGEMQ